MPQSCSFGLSFMTVANYACCAANGACVYFTTCMAGTVYDPVNAVDWWVTLFAELSLFSYANDPG